MPYCQKFGNLIERGTGCCYKRLVISAGDGENQMNTFKNGSCWLKADFHLHTRADSEFAQENDFEQRYIRQLKAQGIGIGVITNHNKFNKDEFVRLHKKANKEGIGLFPGVEFSLKNGIHILIVFDVKWYKGEKDRINEFIGQAFYSIGDHDKTPYPNSGFYLKETVEALDKIDLQYFIVLAHVDDNNGLFRVLKGRTQEDFIKQEAFEKVLAVQKSGNQDNYKRLCDLAGRRIACVEGTDNAREGIQAIGSGRRITYVKVGDFNLEALQYALKDSLYRVKPKEKPEIKHPYIKSVSFEGGLLEDTQIDFSPELNSLIGIRGSGKSSILEIIRYTLGIPLSEIAVDPRYKNELIEHVMKSGGKLITTLVDEHQEEYRIEKIYGQKEDIFKNNIRQPDISIDAVFRQPVYFGQKDLSNKDADFEADLIQRLIGTKLKPVQLQIDNKKGKIDSLIFELKKLEDMEGLRKETETIIENSTHQLKIYKEKGVDEKLKQEKDFDSDISEITRFQKVIASYIEDIENLVNEYDDFFQQEISGSGLNAELFEEVRQLKSELKTEFGKIKKIWELSRAIHGKVNNVISRANEKKEGLKEEFAKIKREINISSINPKKFLELNRQIEIARLKLKEIEKSEKKRKELEQSLQNNLSELNNLWMDEYKLLKKEVDSINIKTKNKLTIELAFKGRRDKFTYELQQVFKGSGIREPTYKSIESGYEDFIAIYRDGSGLKDILNNERQYLDFRSSFSEKLGYLLTFKVDNKIIIKYNDKPLDKHSLGQRASALILFLLAQAENNVLIIDQPEDDLDNQTIYTEVIRELRDIKGSRQFIFATHNANIPVLGDSEKVIACSHDEEKIEINSGTIDNHETQRSIVDIMEGGDEAFKRRKDIYSIWNCSQGK